MIIKAKSRSSAVALASHLMNAETNERISLIQTRGTLAEDVRGALIEMDAYAVGTRCTKPLYHAAISPETPHRLSSEQRMEAVDALEAKLGLSGHARVVILHEKLGREHLHVVWSRIDLTRMRSVSDSHNYRRHEECARDLERRFGHGRVQGAHHERDGVERPARTPSRSELRQEERSGIKGKDVRAEVTRLLKGCDGPEAFRAALENAGYLLAQGDRRDFVIVDRKGEIHSLARRIDGMKAAELREFMQPLDRASVPTAEKAQSIQLASASEGRTSVKSQQSSASSAAPVGSASNSADEEKRLRADRDEDKLEAAFSRGGDYVSQTRAAQLEHRQRQAKLDKFLNQDTLWKRIEDGEKERQGSKQEQPGQARTPPESQRADQGRSPTEVNDRIERLLGGSNGGRDRAPLLDDDPSRQPQAPGVGRSRSR